MICDGILCLHVTEMEDSHKVKSHKFSAIITNSKRSLSNTVPVETGLNGSLCVVNKALINTDSRVV